MYTPAEALEAIKARIKGEWKNPQLLKLGALLPDPLEDVGRIVAKVLIEPISVLFLKEVFPEGEILAVFPDHIEKPDHLLCYCRMNQHSSATKDYVKELKEANTDEYQPLLAELKTRGYNLVILNKTGYKL